MVRAVPWCPLKSVRSFGAWRSTTVGMHPGSKRNSLCWVLEVSEVSVRKSLPRRLRRPGQIESWKKFLRRHATDICAMDFFVVPSATFRLLYGFFVIHHGNREILQFNVTEHPTAQWVIQHTLLTIMTTDRTGLSRASRPAVVLL